MCRACLRKGSSKASLNSVRESIYIYVFEYFFVYVFIYLTIYLFNDLHIQVLGSVRDVSYN